MPESVLTASNSETLADLLPNAAAQYGPDEAFLFKNGRSLGGRLPMTRSSDRCVNSPSASSTSVSASGAGFSILGNTRPEWTLFRFAAMTAGATRHPDLPDQFPEAMPVRDRAFRGPCAGRRGRGPDDPDREIRDNCPKLEKVIVMIGEADDAISMGEIREPGQGPRRRRLGAALQGREARRRRRRSMHLRHHRAAQGL